MRMRAEGHEDRGGYSWADSKEASAKLLNPEAQMLKPLNGQGCNFYLKGWERVGKRAEGEDCLAWAVCGQTSKPA